MSTDEMSDSIKERLILTFSYYRDAELRGARLLFNLIGHMKDGDSQLKMSRHLADETTHAWLWTRRIADLGGCPIPVEDGYQRRMRQLTGIPKTVVDLLALTVAVEERARAQYEAHSARPVVDAETRRVLKAVTEDEVWHLSWIEKKMLEIARQEGCEQRAIDSLARYREIDRQVWAEVLQDLEVMRC
jgi:bacterioferritin (cytochrome b1)